jgi:hypothetical protein
MRAVLHPYNDGIEPALPDIAEQPLVVVAWLGGELRGAESIVDVHTFDGPAKTFGDLPAVGLLATHSQPQPGSIP